MKIGDLVCPRTISGREQKVGLLVEIKETKVFQEDRLCSILWGKELKPEYSLLSSVRKVNA